MISIKYKLYAQISFSLIIIFALLSCSSPDHQANLKRLEQVHGVCDNPMREYTKVEYDNCKAKEKSQGKSLKFEDVQTTLGDLVAKSLGTGNQNSVSSLGSVGTYNRFLWQSSLQTLSPFPLKIADSVGGYLETDWITDFNNNENLRCQIKVFLLSTELVSTGVNTKINCQTFDGNNWIDDNQNYTSEEKKITLTILKAAQEQSQSLS